VCSNSLTDDDLAEATGEGMRRARAAGALVSFDMNLRPALWPKEREPRDALWQALHLADVVKLSAEELAYIAVDGEEAALEALWKGRTTLLVVTDGDRPMRWFHPDMDGELPCYSVPMIDATAAGDAFVGGLLYQLAALEGRGAERLQPLLASLPHLHAVLRYAAACGAIAVGRQGSFTAMPTDAETRHFMETHA
jgi:fructokinase